MPLPPSTINIIKKFGEIKAVSGVRFKVLLDAQKFKTRPEQAKMLAAQTGGKVKPDGKSVVIGNYTFDLKPASLQGSTSSGVSNEHNLVAAINYVIQVNGKNEPINIVFTDGKKKYTIKGCTQAVQAGADTAGRKKSDVNIQTQSGTKPISLKQDNAEYWESADTYWGKNFVPYMQNLVAEGKITLDRQATGDTFVSNNVAVEANEAETKDVVFGSDILINKGAVITRSFIGEDFTWDGAETTLTIKCSSVITQPSEIPDSKKVYFLLRNASGRKSVPGYSGLRVMAAYKSRVTKNTVQISLAQRPKYSK